MDTTKQTGRVRYRVQRIGFLVKRYVCVLQIEWTRTHDANSDDWMSWHPDWRTITYWADARPEDVTTEDEENDELVLQPR